MKKFINDPATVVADALTGMAAAHPELSVDVERRYVARSERKPGKVAVISGGGSGHEPLHAGFVGHGMLDAACPGEVFTSPVPDQILAATQAVHAGAGVVYVVKNYSGDVMNFQLAAELADEEGIAVETVLVDDDVAVERSTFSAGRRGTGATVLVEKIAGAAAEAGASTSEVADIGRRVNACARTFAVALTACTTPATGRPGFDLGADEIEVGVGIHGEPGRARERIRPARELVAGMVDAILSDRPFHTDTIVMVNGLGATPLIEQYLAYGELGRIFAEHGIPIARNLVGNYITSLDMAGISITVCEADGEILRLWDAPVATPALRWGI